MWPDLLRLIITILIFAAMTVAGLIAPRATEIVRRAGDEAPAIDAPPATGASGVELETLGAAEALPALAQQLMDALPADSSVWARYLSERAVYVGEGGEVLHKKELLEGFGPFPPGLKGSIEVKNPRITEFGDVAVIVFDAMETQTVFDQNIDVHYLSTFTWHREAGCWRVISAQTNVVAKDPPALPIDTARLDAYVGTYQLSAERRFRVERRSDALFGGREGSEPASLIAVGDNVFADAGSNLGILRVFVTGADGKVNRMLVRRKFADLSWRRVD
jgi:Domain of unknown function (DUF4440)